jgi:hypothetical protein
VRGGLSPEDRATLQRWAFRAYNACGTGDLEDPKSVFDKLETEKRALKLMGATKSSEKTAIYRRATRHSVTRWMEVSMRSSTGRSSPSSIAKADAINMTADAPPAANALSRVAACVFVVSARFRPHQD